MPRFAAFPASFLYPCHQFHLLQNMACKSERGTEISLVFARDLAVNNILEIGPRNVRL